MAFEAPGEVTTVYVVRTNDWEDNEVLGIYTSPKAAQQRADTIKFHGTAPAVIVEEYELDVDMPHYEERLSAGD
jgi:hypothetical protein